MGMVLLASLLDDECVAKVYLTWVEADSCRVPGEQTLLDPQAAAVRAGGSARSPDSCTWASRLSWIPRQLDGGAVIKH